MLLSFIPSSPYTFNYDDLYSKWAQWGLGFASFWTKKMVYKTDQTLFRWFSVFKMAAGLLPLYHHIVILGASLVLGAVHFRHYRRLWMGQWMKKFGLGKKDLYSFPSTSSGCRSFVFIDGSCLPNVRHALKWMGGKDVCQVTKTGIPRGELGV